MPGAVRIAVTIIDTIGHGELLKAGHVPRSTSNSGNRLLAIQPEAGFGRGRLPAELSRFEGMRRRGMSAVRGGLCVRLGFRQRFPVPAAAGYSAKHNCSRVTFEC